MAGKGGRSFVTPGSDSRGNSNLNRTKKHQSQKIKDENVKRRKNPKGINGHMQSKVRAARHTGNCFQGNWKFQKKNISTIKQGERGSKKINMKT